MADLSSDDEERWYLVVTVVNGDIAGFSRRADGERGPFTGPWKLLTVEEAEELQSALDAAPDANPANGDHTQIVEVYRYVNDPGWPEEYA